MTTALELTPAEWERYTQVASGQLLPESSAKPSSESGIPTGLMTRLERAAQRLKADFGVRRVILFGSLAHQAWFVPDSDVDLAVEGLEPADYWTAWRAVEAIISDRRVDLIEVETASPSLRRTLQRHGLEL